LTKAHKLKTAQFAVKNEPVTVKDRGFSGVKQYFTPEFLAYVKVFENSRKRR